MLNNINRRAWFRRVARSRRVLAVILLALGAVGYSTAAPELAIVEGPDFGTLSVGVVDGVTLSATGGSGAYAWTVASGSLPPGISIRTDLPASAPQTASAALAGVATTPGTYTFTLQVSSGTQQVQKVCTITISSLSIKSSVQLPVAFVGVGYTYAFTALLGGNPVPASWTMMSGLPPGMAMTSDGVLSGAPSLAGLYHLSFSTSSGSDVISGSADINVSALSITTPAELPDAVADAPYNLGLTASGGASPYSFVSSGLPTGLTLDPSGTLSGVLASGSPRAVFAVTVTDAGGLSYTKSLAIQLAGLQPAIAGATLDDCSLGAACSRSVSLLSHGAAPVVWSVTGLPPGMDFRTGDGNTSPSIAAGDLELWGAPAAAGSYQVQVTATDSGGAAATNVFALTISTLSLTNQLPNGITSVPYASGLRVIGGRSLPNVGVPAQDGTGAYSATLVGGQLPSALVLTSSTLLVSGTPLQSGTFAPIFLATSLDGQTIRATRRFSIAQSPAPAVSGVSPGSGPTAGGTTVTITGTGFLPGAAVYVGGQSATNVNIVNATTITAVTPPGAAGTTSITVTNRDSQSGTLAGAFKYAAPPTVSGVSPASGPTAGGTLLTISGTGFLTGATVTVGVSAASNVSVQSATTITTLSPAGPAGSAAVTVINPDGQSSTAATGFLYVAPPTIIGVTPSSGPSAGGTAVTISGSNFTAGATVTVGSAAATGVTVVNSSTISAVTPAGATGPASIKVTNPDGQSATATAAFTYSPPPTVGGVTPSSGPTSGGTAVTITGSNFQAGATVTFGTTPATSVTVVNATTLTATTPAGSAGAAAVVVTNTDGQTGTRASAFTYVPPPAVLSVTPASGATAGGTSITIGGTAFTTGATVTIGQAAATSVVVVNSSTITAVTPAGATGAVAVTVRNPDGQTGTRAAVFTYVPPPAVTSVTPALGPTSGGTAVTIAGSNFTSGATVTIGSTAATSVIVVSSTSITAVTPVGTAGTATVSVTNPDSQKGTLAGAFTYVAPPTVTAVAPNSGPIAGGTTVTITGTNFMTGSTVSVGGAPATNVTVVSATSITAVTPALREGAADVTVVNSLGQSGTRLNGFSYMAPAPTVTAVTPSSGPTSGGTTLTISGSNFAAIGSTADMLIDLNTADPVGTTVTPTIMANGTIGTYSGSWYASTTPLPGFTVGAHRISRAAPVTVGGVVYALDHTSRSIAIDHASGLRTISAGIPSGHRVATMAGFITFGPPKVTTSSATLFDYWVIFTPSGDYAVLQLNNGDHGNYAINIETSRGGTQHTADLVITPGATYWCVLKADFNTGTAILSAYETAGWTMVGSVTSTTLSIGQDVGSIRIGNNEVGTAPGTTSYFENIIFNYTNGTTSLAPQGSGAVVSVGGNVATSVNVVSPTTISALTPAGSAGASTVTVTNPDGLSGARAAGFTYAPPPVVNTVTPASGPMAGGTPITITGTGFVAGAAVTVGGVAAASVNVVNATTIAAVTPAGPVGPVAVTVTNPDGQISTSVKAFTFVAPPSISAIAPVSGSTTGGTALTISGANFVAGATVRVGSNPATSVIVVNATTITATTPTGAAGAASVAVTNPDGQSVTGAQAFSYVAPPAVTSVTPSSGPTAGGTSLTIGGSGFVAGATVKVGSGAATAVTVISGSTITASTPPGPASVVSVTVTNPDGQVGTRANGFTYVAPPTVSSVTPNSGPATGGTVVTITGTNFAAGAAVTIGPNAASNVAVTSSTALTAVTPAGPAGAQTVTVINPDGQSASLAGSFTSVQTDVALFGSLTARDSGVAIANASIKLCVPANVLESGGTCTALTTTDANGLYSLKSSQLGTGVMAGALLFQALGFYADLQPFTITIPPVQLNTTALRGGAVLHGSVTDAASQDGIVGATVALTLDSPSISADGPQPISVVTGTMGVYDVDSSHFMEPAANGFSVTAGSAGTVSAPGYQTFTVPAFAAALPYPQVENFPLTPAGPVVSVTVGTSPSAAAFAVDGLNYMASRVFSWPVDSIHTLTLVSPQSSSTSILTFQAWSDNGALSHPVTVTAGVNAYTAAFDAQYLLTTSVNPPSGGSITPGGWFNAGSVASIAASANPSYQFTGFSGALSGVITPQSLTVNAPATVVANFATTNLAPTITSAPSAIFDVITARTFTVTATGSPAPSLSETGVLPAGVTFDPPSGVLGGTPASGTSGTYNITFVATNGVAPNAVQSFTLIVNPPYLTSLSLDSSSVVGGLTNATGTVTLDAPGEGSTAQRTVTLSSSNPAAATVPATVTVATGATTATFTVTSRPVASTTTTTVTATLGAQTKTVVVTVTPAPQVSGLTLTPASVVGGSANATATVTLSGPAAGTTAQRTVTLTSSNAAAATVPASVTVAAGATSATFTVTSLAVTAVATPVITATLGASATATLTVNPLTVAQVSLSPTSVVGGVANSTGTVTLTAAAAGTTAQRTVTLSSDNTAAATVPATVTVGSGATTATFTITSKTVSAATTATITASMNGGIQSAILAVTPPPQVTGITLNQTSVVGGSANATGTVTLSGPASGTSSQRTVVLSSSNTTAATVPASVTVASGATAATFTVTSKVVTAAMSATITATLNGSATATLAVTPHIVTQVTLSPAMVVGGTANATATVTLNAPAEGTSAQRTVTLSSSSTAAAGVPANITVASGSSTATFTVTSHLVASPTIVTITATMNGSTNATLAVNPVTVARLTLNPTAVTGGSGNTTGTVTLNAPATGNSAQRTVTLSSSNTAAATVPASVTVATGATSATFTVTSKAVTSTTAVTIAATQNGGSQSAVLTVN
jgi:hypothetical protein